MSRNDCVLTVCVFDPAGLEWKMTQLFTPLQVMHGPILVMLARFNSTGVKLIHILSKHYIFKQNHFINWYYFTLDSSDVSVTIVRHGYVAARFHLLWPTNFHARCSGTTDPDRADASSGARLNFEHSRAVWRHTSGEHTCPTGAESGHDSSWRCQPRVGSPEAVSISDRSEWDPGKDSPNGSSPSSQLQRSRVWHLTDLLWQWMTAMTCLQLGSFHDAKMSWWDISWKCLTKSVLKWNLSMMQRRHDQVCMSKHLQLGHVHGSQTSNYCPIAMDEKESCMKSDWVVKSLLKYVAWPMTYRWHVVWPFPWQWRQWWHFPWQ